MDLRSTQLKDTYGNLVTTGTTAGSPTSGGLQNGQGTLLTSVGIGTNSQFGGATLTVTDNTDNFQSITAIGQDVSSEYISMGIAGTGESRITAGGASTTSNSLTFHTANSGTETERMRINSGGDISFRDGSNNEAFYWDASTARLGIGTTSPSEILNVKSAGSTADQITLTHSGNTVNIVAIGQASSHGSLILRSNSGVNKVSLSAAGNDSYILDSNVGIGTTSVTSGYKMQVDGAIFVNGGKVAIGLDGTEAEPSLSINDGDSGFFRPSANNIGISTAGTERMRIDSSGNVLVGKTASNYANEGIELRPTEVLVTKDSGTVLSLRRNTSDGTILSFAKDGTSVGSIGSASGNIYLDSASTGRLYSAGTARLLWDDIRLYPNADDSYDLGLVTNRFDDVYATNGTIQTSDINEKQDIEELNDAELRVAQKAKTLLRKFRWKSSVEENENARIHFGIIAQDLEQAFTDEGLDAGRYGMFIKSTWTNEEGEEQTRLGVRYNQLLAFIISAL